MRLSGVMANLDGPEAGCPWVLYRGAGGDEVLFGSIWYIVVEPEQKDTVGGGHPALVDKPAKIGVVGYQSTFLPGCQLQQVRVEGTAMGFPDPKDVVAPRSEQGDYPVAHIFVNEESHRLVSLPSGRQQLRSSQV